MDLFWNRAPVTGSPVDRYGIADDRAHMAAAWTDASRLGESSAFSWCLASLSATFVPPATCTHPSPCPGRAWTFGHFRDPVYDASGRLLNTHGFSLCLQDQFIAAGKHAGHTLEFVREHMDQLEETLMYLYRMLAVSFVVHSYSFPKPIVPDANSMEKEKPAEKRARKAAEKKKPPRSQRVFLHDGSVRDSLLSHEEIAAPEVKLRAHDPPLYLAHARRDVCQSLMKLHKTRKRARFEGGGLDPRNRDGNTSCLRNKDVPTSLVALYVDVAYKVGWTALTLSPLCTQTFESDSKSSETCRLRNPVCALDLPRTFRKEASKALDLPKQELIPRPCCPSK
jgi:hypothetical protein